MRRFLVGLLALIGLLSLLLLAGLGGLAWWGLHQLHQPQTLPDRVVLRLDLEGSLADAGEGGVLRRLVGSNKRAELRPVIEALTRAERDPHVVAVFADLSGAAPPLATAEELADAVQRFRRSGKPAVAFADSFGEGSGGSQAYLLAAAFDQVWLQPSGALAATGFNLEQPFFTDLLAKLGIVPRMSQRHEYKGGIDSFTQHAFPAPFKAQLGGVVDDLFGQLVQRVAAARRLSEPAVRALIDRAPLFADEAHQAGLIDAVGYRDQAESAVRGRADGHMTGVADYLAGSAAPAGDVRFAVIRGSGAVVRGTSGDDEDALDGAETLDATQVAKAFARAARDPEVRVILFRVDSPGGSYVASDTVWRAVKQARAAGKPVVASMGAVAGSGGYFVAMACDRIVAEPATLTGSIGVFSGKFVLTGLWDKLGIAWDHLQAGANADLYDFNRDFSDTQRARFEASLDRIYADFAGRAAADRNIPPARMDQLARGRIWTGRQARELGLVDALGGLDDAVLVAKQLAGLPADAAVRVEPYPPPRSTFERALRLVERMDADAGGLAPLARLATLLGALAEARTAPLAMPVATP